MTRIGGETGAVFIDDQINLLGPARFYSDTFINCGLKLESGANPTFMFCVLRGCTFDPPFESPAWDFLRNYGNIIDFESVDLQSLKATQPAPAVDLPAKPYIEACKVWGAAVKRRIDRGEADERQPFSVLIDCLRAYEFERQKPESDK